MAQESLATFVAHRNAFGAVPLPPGLGLDRLVQARAQSASAYVGDDGRVILDWHLLLVSGTAHGQWAHLWAEASRY